MNQHQPEQNDLDELLASLQNLPQPITPEQILGVQSPQVPASLMQLQSATTRYPKIGGKNKAPDDGQIAARWIANNPSIAYGLGKWRRYINGIYEPEDEDLILRSIRQTCELARQENFRVTAARLRSIIELIRIEVSVPDSRWDTDPNLIPMRNGLLDLRTRQLLPHTPTVHATSCLGYDYDPDADCPQFKALLKRIGDAADFLQEFAGYCLTPDMRFEISVWMQGIQGCGKSTVLEGFHAMLGSRVGHLGLDDIQRSRFSLANVPGKTLLTSAEQPNGSVTKSQILNTLISGETIIVEDKFEKAFEVRPIAKILWAMNHIPRINDAHNGLMRRVKIIAFPPLEAGLLDPNLKDRIPLEAAGILNWALEGLARLHARGRFDIPATVLQSTDDFRSRNDLPMQFLSEVGARIDLTDPKCRTSGQYLYNEYANWCRSNGHDPESSIRLADDWRRLGFRRIRVQGHSVWVGVEVTPQMTMVHIPQNLDPDPE